MSEGNETLNVENSDERFKRLVIFGQPRIESVRDDHDGRAQNVMARENFKSSGDVVVVPQRHNAPRELFALELGDFRALKE